MLAISAAAALAAFNAPMQAAPAALGRASVSMKAAPPKAKGKGWLQKSRLADDIDVTGNQYVNVAGLTPQFDEIGVLPPLGRWDPLNIKGQGEARYRRFVEMEIKHGRMAMAAVLGVLTTYSGIRFPGYLSKTLDLKFEDVPGTMIGSWATVPVTGWIQIVLFVVLLEASWWKQDPKKAPGDVVPEGTWWARYPDGYSIFLGDGSVKTVAEDELFLGKTWKLNAERNNGRAAMMGITGMYVHELLTGNPVYPLGEL